MRGSETGWVWITTNRVRHRHRLLNRGPMPQLFEVRHRAYIRLIESAAHPRCVGSTSARRFRGCSRPGPGGPATAMLTLQLFGGCALVAHGEAIGGPAAQRRRLALLALLGSSPGGGLSRDKLVAYFWPEEDRDRARHFLSDSLFTLRKTLGKDVLLKAGDDVRVNPDVLDVDVMQFEQLVARGDLAEAVALYRGPFLDGFFIADAPEFERWAESERDRLARRYALCVEQLATSREVISDWTTAAEWWQVLATHDPYGSRIALRAMRALEANGDAAAALRHGLAHESRVRDELGLEPDPSVVALVDRLRTRPEASLATPHDVPRVAAVPAPKHATVPAGVPATAPGSRGMRASPNEPTRDRRRGIRHARAVDVHRDPSRARQSTTSIARRDSTGACDVGRFRRFGRVRVPVSSRRRARSL